MLRIISQSIRRPLITLPSFGIKNWKLPASEIDSTGLMGFF
jgi:hypothetical protein